MTHPRLTVPVLLCAAFAAACSTTPDRPEVENSGSSGYALARNQACLLDAQRAWNFGKYTEVERVLARWQGPMEESAPLRLLGQVAFATKKYGLSAELFDRALEFEPESTSLLLLTARAQEASGQAEPAARSYLRTLQQRPDHADAAVGLLRCLITLSDTTRALEFARENAEQFGNHAEYLSLAADLAFTQADFESSVSWYQAAQRLGATSPGSEERLILALSWTERHEEALGTSTAVSSADWTPEVHRALGRSGLALGQSALAARHLQFYLGSRPEDPGAWLDLARAQFLAGNPEHALAAVEKSLARAADSAPAQLLYAHCLLQLGQDAEAAYAYSTSLALGAHPAEVQPFLDLLVMQGGNSLQPQPASSAKEMAVSPQD